MPQAKKVKTGGPAEANAEEYDDELEDAKHVQLFKQISTLSPELQKEILQFTGMNIQEIKNYEQWLIRNKLQNVSDVADQIAFEDVKDLKEIARTIVFGTPREQFDTLCAHMKKGEYRNLKISGVPVHEPAGPRLEWTKSAEKADIWAQPIANGLKNPEHNGIDLSDICKLLDSCIDCTNAKLSSDEDLGYLQEYWYKIRIPDDMLNILPDYLRNYISIGIVHRKTEPISGFEIRIENGNQVNMEFEIDNEVTKLVQNIKRILSSRSSTGFWEAFVDFAAKGKLVVPFEESIYSVRLMTKLLTVLVYMQNYPFFFGEAIGGDANPHDPRYQHPVSFRASFVDKCLAL